MMNVLALCLVLSSLAAGGMWSPQPEMHKEPREKVIVKEGHRVIVVEYEREGLRNPEVSISTQETGFTHSPLEVEDKTFSSTVKDTTTGVVDNAKEKFKEASSVLPNLGQGISTSTQSSPPPPSNNVHIATPGELICDALGKCKRKIAGTFNKVKEGASEKAHAVEEGAKETVGKAKQAGEAAADKTKAMGENLAANFSEKVKTAREEIAEKAKQAEGMAEDVVDRVKTSTHDLKEEAKHNLTEILRRGRDVVTDAVTYAVSAETLNPLMGMVRLLGFSAAYGMCVWVTFVSSHVLAGALPRQQFGIVQSKIYPVYFRAMAYSICVSLLAQFLSRGGRLLSSRPETLQGLNLLTALAMVLTNLVYLEPRATKVMFERMKMEKEEGRGRDDADMVVDPLPVTETTTTTSTTPTPIGISGARTLETKAATTGVTPIPGRLMKQQEMVKSRLGKLNQRLKKLNTWSSFLNVMTLMSLTWHLVYLGQRLHITC